MTANEKEGTFISGYFRKVVTIVVLLIAFVVFLPEAKGDHVRAGTGTWIQADNGRWWYKHPDGSFTANGWEYIMVTGTFTVAV